MRKFLVFLVVLAALWTGAWYAVSLFAGGRLDDIIAREAQRGRKIACIDRASTGFPFAFRIACSRFEFEVVPPGRPLKITTGATTVGVSLASPMTVVADIGAPMEIVPADRAPIRLDWRSGRGTLGIENRRPADLKIEVTALVATIGDRGAEPVKADNVSLQILPAPAEAGAAAPGPFPSALTARLYATGVSVPAADRLARSDRPANLRLDATVTGLAGAIGLPLPLALDRWRRASGRVDIENFLLAKGDLDLQASGTLALDEERRLAGRIRGTSKGLPFEPREPRSRVGELAARAGAAAANVRIPFALTLENGVAKLGPVKIADLPPLY